FYYSRHHPPLHSFPTRRSSDLYQQAMCRIFDNMYEWALNAYDIPFASYVGENDRSVVKHNSAKEQLIREGIHFEGDPFTLKAARSEEHTSELQSPYDLVCRLLL